MRHRHGGPAVLKYEVRFNISERGLQENKIVPVGVNDTGDERINQADAIVAASLALDDQGIRHWVLKGCVKVTS